MRIMFVLFQVLALVFAVNSSSSQELNSTLRVTEYGVPFAFIGETIIFTCRTERSNSIGWSSDEYIGVNRLNFASAEPDGTTRAPTDSGAVAQLVSSTRVNGTVILVSQLQITVQSMYQIASITCHNIGVGEVNTTAFRMAENTSIICDEPAICPEVIASCICTTAHSNSLSWSINNGTELLFNSGNLSLYERWTVSNSSNFAVISSSDISVLNGVVVLKSGLSFSFLLQSSYIILTCENGDNQDSYSIILPVYRECHSSTTIGTTTINEPVTATQTRSLPAHTSASGVSTGLAVAFGTVTTLFVLVLYFAAVIIVCLILMRRRHRLGKQDFELSDMNKHIQRTEKDCLSTDEDMIAMQTSIGEALRIESNSSSTDKDLITMQQVVSTTPETVKRGEDCSSNTNPFISTDEDMPTMVISVMGGDTNEAQESDKKTGISNPSVEEETVIPQLETGDHSSSSVMRSFDVMECTERPRILSDKRMSLSDAYLDQDEQIHVRILHEKIQQLEKQRETGEQMREEIRQQEKHLREKDEQLHKLRVKIQHVEQELQKLLREREKQIAVLEKTVTDMKLESQNKEEMADKQIHELKLKVFIYEQQLKEKIPVMTDGHGNSRANEDTQEANVVWKGDRLHVAHTGNFRPSIPGSCPGTVM